MNKGMNFTPTQEAREYEQRLRESIRQREQLKHKLSELENRKHDLFWDVEYAMLETGIKYFDTCAEYYVYRLEYEHIKAENRHLSSSN